MSLEYIKDMDDNFWIVTYQYNHDFYGYPVYMVDEHGDRHHPESELTYKKRSESYKKIPNHYKCIYHPKDCYMAQKDNLPDIWKKFIEALHIIGIDDSSLGIFGSTLCGFPVIKDVDFTIYGKENLEKYHKNQLFVKAYMGADYISKEHVEYQYHKYRHLYSPQMDLMQILSNNWSGIQLSNGVLSTPRFIIDENFDIPKISNHNETIVGTVYNSLTSSCTPRIFSLATEKGNYTVITPLWMLQSCVRDNDKIKLFGEIDHSEKIILIITKEHYLQYE
ncbi:hypothetical protein [Hungatella hathewayi]|uniref:hypothetical protein n=1 Tax=Hungatella hathewayi TaxID=154046 RepID=UPI003563DD58